FGGALAKLRQFKIGVLNVTAHSEVRTVDLEIEPRGDDCLVFRPHRIRNRGEISALARIVVVAKEEGYDAWRRGGHERPLGRIAPQSRPQVLDIAAYAVGVGDGDGAVAGRRLPPRRSGIAEPALRHIWERDEVLIDERVPRPSEPGQAILDVGRVARL